MTLERVYRKLRNGERIDREEGLFVLNNADLLDLGEIANEIRFRKNPKPWVTWVSDTNPNYSNICTIDCIFCAFYRHPGEEGEYTHSVDHMIQKFKESASKGITTVLLQGGVNPALPLEYYLELIERTINEVPQVYPHFFSTSEIIGMANVSGLSIPDVLR
ncbi:MAG TPA: radical SAM protein, partial [Terriglobia bacterium]|nr:radical SAM protein [Terriglobia bacterium]